jgi:hypothetical protein
MIDLGKVTGLSPERTKYVLEELLTKGTVWSYLMGKGYDELFGTDMPEDKRQQHLAMVLARTPLIKRFIGVTNPYTQFEGSIDEATELSVLESFIQTRELDRLVEGHIEGNVKASEIDKYIGSIKDPDDQDRLYERYDFKMATKDLPNKAFWLTVKNTPPDARAKVFVDRLEGSSKEERAALYSELAKVDAVGGIVTDKFLDEVVKLQRQ